MPGTLLIPSGLIFMMILQDYCYHNHNFIDKELEIQNLLIQSHIARSGRTNIWNQVCEIVKASGFPDNPTLFHEWYGRPNISS